MSSMFHESASSFTSESEEEKRAQRLASARKKLQTFRASRSSEQSDVPSIASSSSKPPSPTKMMPLTTEASINSPFTFPPSHSRSSSKGKDKEVETDIPDIKHTGGHKHRRSDSQAHRRQRSSIAIPAGMTTGQGLTRPSVMGVFDGAIDRPTTPMASLLNSPEVSSDSTTSPDDNQEEIAARLSSFSFGAKPPMSTFPPKRRQQPFVPSPSLFEHDAMSSPLASPTSSVSAPNLNRLSTPSSRPPSLVFTHPTPLSLGSPAPSGPSRASLASLPSSPPTPARRKHSHTRSNSISLPNLKMGGARPTSLGIPPPTSIPSSPRSPGSGGEGTSRSSLSSPITGQRLKFEPSGRGAEAEKDRSESRRKALEKLTGAPSLSRSPVFEPQVAEISLPDLDDEDTSSVASSNRPLSGVFGSGSGSSFFSRPSSLTLPPLTASTASTSSALSASPFSWSSPNEQQSPVERWSGFGFGLAKEYGKDDGMSFGMDVSTAMAKRPSITRQLSALAEVDESEEDEMEFEDEAIAVDMIRSLSDGSEGDSSYPVEPTPNRLRELRLGSSISSSTPRQDSFDTVHTFSFPRQSSTSPSASSPTKVYGSIGRGRPKPLTMGSTSSTPTSMSTPKSAGFSARKRAAPGSGSRGSSISYKKDDSSSSSHDLSIGGSRNVFSPEALSPPLESPRFAGWGNSTKANLRPCPRPRTLVGLGIDSATSGRVLGELEEAEEETSPNLGSMWTSPIPDDADIPRPYAGYGSHDAEARRDSFAEESEWRDVQLDLEMEREALKEDVAMWKLRCGILEDKLAVERKESSTLRDRVRKLGDRLSSVSSVPTERSSSESHAVESRLIAEMREQLFNLTTTLEAERKAKEEAFVRLAENERSSQKSYDESEDDELLLTARPDQEGPFQQVIASPIITPPSPLPPNIMSSGITTPLKISRDPNLARIKGWGFPKEPSVSPPSKTDKSKKRESFFGLSTVLKRSVSADEAEIHNGVDLPCFSLPESTSTSTPSVGNLDYPTLFAFNQNQFADSPRAVSDPIPTKPRSNSIETTASLSVTANGTGTGFTSSAVSFLSSYLPHKTSLDEPRKEKKSYTSRFIHKEEQRIPEKSNIAQMDFRHGCRCCVGAVIEL
ncbi:uncharacterized protein IL334_004692 [Kwoniella shivajii]|uniref:Proteophosphoglycan ppg4 n=1 Tax=Kwoniella shivajii TaxID=564305 RepID=A0ABZ1D122_9TREE|nr:hypothetical protein IL334_004692 [Kwoniella shivajii]